MLTCAALLLAMTACESTPAPTGRIDVPVRADGRRVEVAANVGAELRIALPPVAHAGDAWTLVLHDPRYLKIVRPVTTTPDGGTVSFLALKPGRRFLRFLAIPPAHREAIATQAYDIRVEIQ